MPPEFSSSGNNANWTSFQAFFQGWLIRQRDYHDQLISAITNIQTKTDDELNTLVSETLSHYQQYYQAKSITARSDVFIMFAPPWFTSLEHSFLWISGFKPSLAFKILTSSVNDLDEEQLQSMERLRAETRVAERELSDEMARVQESVATPPFVDLARRRMDVTNPTVGLGRQAIQQEMRIVDSALHSLREAMEALVESADFIRMATARKVVEILTPVQAVKFLAAATQLQVRIREWGLQRDANRRRTTDH